MAQLTIKTMARPLGINLSTPDPLVASSGSDQWANTGREFCYFTNLTGAPITVTFATPNTIDGLGITDLTLSVPASSNHIMGPFPPAYYNDANGNCVMTYSSSGSNFRVGVFQLAREN